MTNELAAVPIYMIGSAITESGKNGSGAWVSRHPNASDKRPEAATRAIMGRDSHGYREPPQVSASNSGTAAAIIRPAPRIASLGRRSWRGSRLSRVYVIMAAASASGRLIQKISDQ